MSAKLEIKLLGVGEHPLTKLLRTRTQDVIARSPFVDAIDLTETSEIESMVEAQLNGIPALVIESTILCEEEVPPIDQLEMLLTAYLSEWQQRAA